jgi:apolipoprotein N-acyltransferase
MLSALLLALAFPRPGWGVLGFVALVPMTALALRSARPALLAIVTYLVFLAWWLLMIRWMIPVTVGGWIGLCVLMSVYSALMPLLLRRLVGRLDLPCFIALPMVWVSLEWLRGWAFAGGFGWCALSCTQAPAGAAASAPHLIQIADIGGEWSVSFLLAMVNGLIVDLLVEPWFTVAANGPRRFSRRLLIALAVTSVCLGCAWAYGRFRIREADRVLTPGPRLAVVQTNVPQNNKMRPSDATEHHDWEQLLDLSAAAATSHPDLIVWPETVSPAPLDADSLQYYKPKDPAWPASAQVADQLDQLCRRNRASLLLGAHAWTWQLKPDGYLHVGSIYNSAYLFTPDAGESPRRYDKIHRVPFGEFIPWIEDWPWLKTAFMRLFSPYGPDRDYTVARGKSLTVFEVPWPLPAAAAAQPAPPPRHFRCATPICFEDTDACLCARLVYLPDGGKRADALINLTNDGWFAHSWQQPQQLQSAVFRCIENRVPMARSVNTGISGFIDSVGRVGPLVSVAGRSQSVAGWAAQNVSLDPRVTVFGYLRDWPIAALACLTALLLLGGGILGRRTMPPSPRR